MLISVIQVNCLTEFFYEEGLKQAKELDELLDKGGKLKGPLHGVPIALKVCQQQRPLCFVIFILESQRLTLQMRLGLSLLEWTSLDLWPDRDEKLHTTAGFRDRDSTA